MKKLFLIISLLAILSTVFFLNRSRNYDTQVAKILDEIPVQDKKSLENLLRRELWYDQFAFTLFGSKAVAIAGYSPKLPAGNIHHRPFRNIRKDEFEAWERHNHYFQSENFLWKTDKISWKYS